MNCKIFRNKFLGKDRVLITAVILLLANLIRSQFMKIFSSLKGQKIIQYHRKDAKRKPLQMKKLKSKLKT